MIVFASPGCWYMYDVTSYIFPSIKSQQSDAALCFAIFSIVSVVPELLVSLEAIGVFFSFMTNPAVSNEVTNAQNRKSDIAVSFFI